MCFGGKPKTPAVQAAPEPSPAPVITPSESESMVSEAERKNRLKRLRAGLASTIKTSPKGVAGNEADLMSQSLTGKDKLGA